MHNEQGISENTSLALCPRRVDNHGYLPHGAALVFERDITESLDPELYKVTYTEGNAPLPPSELVAAIRRQVPDSLELLSLQLPGERDGVCMATFKGTGKRSLSVNPYTGEVNGWTKKLPFLPDHAQTAPVADGPACL